MAQVPANQSTQSGLAPRRTQPLQRLTRDLDMLFDRLWGRPFALFDQDLEEVRLWDFDVKENDKEIVVRAEMPGFEEKELNIQIDNNVLTIKAEKEQKGNGQEEYRSFYRTITLPSGINADKVQATYRNGVLELHIPRAEGAQPKRIQVQGQQSASGRAEAAPQTEKAKK